MLEVLLKCIVNKNKSANLLQQTAEYYVNLSAMYVSTISVINYHEASLNCTHF
jgi:hypothetical protein